ncbi:putative mei5 protein [Rosellinia necatrix]|uniref:Putative mei5 protein n=1 Tax=Rosellinia necatrix TaxID=77044 RepID=A0A1W2TJ39_ROSNE|nr:putative mei5 protein [Rosellinia necatrix]
MASATDTQEVKAKGVSTPKVDARTAHEQVVNNKDVSSFFELLRKLADINASTDWINKILHDNDELHATVKQKESDCDSLLRFITKLQGNLDIEVGNSLRAISQSEEAKTKAEKLTTEIEGAKKTIADKDQQLKERATKITELQASVEALEKQVKDRDGTITTHKERQAKDGARIKELEASLGTTKTELNARSSQLKDLQSLSREVVDGSRENVLNEINKIYGYAKSLAIEHFSADLPTDILANTALIEEVGKLVRPIPFPATNSPAAKKARMAAFLARLGSRLADRIFLPFYPLDGDDEDQDSADSMALMLSDLSLSDPKREIHLRSVLLAISPEEQKEVALARASDIADEIINLLGILLNPEQQPKFKNDIKKLCQLAVESWISLQVLREKVEPFTETSEETEKYWLPAELEGSAQPKKPQVNGKPNGLVSKPSLHSLKSANKVILIWPGFSYGADVLKQGFMLLDSQVKHADDEARPLKREKRAMQRASLSAVQSHRLSTGRKPKMMSRGD